MASWEKGRVAFWGGEKGVFWGGEEGPSEKKGEGEGVAGCPPKGRQQGGRILSRVYEKRPT